MRAYNQETGTYESVDVRKFVNEMKRGSTTLKTATSPPETFVTGRESQDVTEAHQLGDEDGKITIALDLVDAQGMELIHRGRKLLWGKKIRSKCCFCDSTASDVYIEKTIGVTFRIEILPVCEGCKQDEAWNIVEGEY
ncbi:MAG: hypothetical protein JEY79_11865 [Pseudodesulfovibrio sp.]|nr:hypothetical protein [Pseudodesulfovibrio sp.]